MIARTDPGQASPLVGADPRPGDPPTIAVVIPNWNGASVLPSCLGSLRDQTILPTCVCVVDNGSTDGSAATEAARDPELHVVALPTNTGFGAAVNAGIEATQTDWVLVLNSDTRLEPETIEVLAHAAESAAADVGTIQPLLLLDNGSARINSTGIEVRSNGEARDRDFDAPLWTASAEGEVFGATGGAALYRRDMLVHLSEHGPVFDSTFFMYFEDVDLAWRARLAGWRTMFTPHAVVHHRFQASSAQHASDFVAVQCTLNRIRCLVKNASGTLLLRSAWRTLGDARWLFRRLGGSALRRIVIAWRDGLRGRASVSRLASKGRRPIELAWVRPTPRQSRVRRRRAQIRRALDAR